MLINHVELEVPRALVGYHVFTRRGFFIFELVKVYQLEPRYNI